MQARKDIPQDDIDTPDARLERYKDEIAYYDQESQAWRERVRKILRRYKDERSPREVKSSRYNILYSNISTLMPAIYGNNPKPDIERRYKDDDVLGRITSDILERTATFFVQKKSFRKAMKRALFDRLIGGRGIFWSRYVPHFKDMEINSEDDSPEEEEEGLEVTNSEDEEAVSDELVDDEPLEEVSFEEVATDYVHWDDFGHNWARTDDEIYLKWRKVFLTRKELIARFGKVLSKEEIMEIPLDYAPKGLADQKKQTAVKKAVIYELWDDTEKRACWMHKDFPKFLDDKEDPLKLDGFFPCQELYGILANDSMIPVPDYAEYQDQANELDEITSRISAITKCIKVAGIYDASAPGIERLLAEGVENRLIPVDQWAVLAEKGGIKGVISFLPLEEIVKALLALYDAQEKVKQALYEITGLSDIVRGSTKVETAKAQQIKANFTTLRLSDSQDDMAQFACDAVRNICIIIANHFSIDTIKQISGVKLFTAQEKAGIQQRQAVMKQQFQQATQNYPAMKQQNPQLQPPPPPPPLDDDMQELMENPTWEEVEQLLRDNAALSFKIDIEVDSTIKMDEDADKASRIEFLKAASQFIGQAMTAGTQMPSMAPLFAHMLMFGVRGFKIGKELEGQFRVAVEKLEKQAANPQPHQSPEQQKIAADTELQKMKMQQQAQNDERDAQREDKRMQLQASLDQQKMQWDIERDKLEMQNELTLKREEAALDLKKHEMTTSATQKPTIQLDTNGMVDEAAKHLNILAQGIGDTHKKMIETANNTHGALTNAASHLSKAAQAIHEKANKPKTITMKGHDGRILQAQVQ